MGNCCGVRNSTPPAGVGEVYVTPTEAFSRIYDDSLWGSQPNHAGSTSRSGVGSTLELTNYARAGMDEIITKYQPVHFLDVACGESDWLRPVITKHDETMSYTGADVVVSVIQHQRASWPKNLWCVLDVCEDFISTYDMILCRDCFVHLPFNLIFQALSNLKSSGSKYLVMTTFPKIPEGNNDIKIGGWRRLDFTASPFNLPQPIMIVNECGPKLPNPQDKSLGVWTLNDLRC